MSRLPAARWWSGCLLLLGAGLAGHVSGAPAGAPNTTPYLVFVQALSGLEAARTLPRLRGVARIESKQPGVRPEQIRLLIHARSGDRLVQVRADGSFDFPVDAALRSENPPVESNQPKGSLTLTVNLQFAAPGGNRWQIADAIAALADIDRLIAPGAPKIRGIELRFPPSALASVTLRGDSERLLVADTAGRIILMRDTDLAEGVREIEFGQKPQALLPYVGN